MAMGILMQDRSLDEDDAFAALRQLSQHSNRKLRDVAEDVIDHRGIPPGSERAERLRHSALVDASGVTSCRCRGPRRRPSW